MKWIGPSLLLLVVAFGITSFFARKYVEISTVFLIMAVLIGVTYTFVVEVRDARRKERENAG
ncbi:MAG: hypothetical protein ACAH95_13330 [Fimbriimonas sp.]